MSADGTQARYMANVARDRLGIPDWPSIAVVYALLDVADAIRQLAKTNQEVPS